MTGPITIIHSRWAVRTRRFAFLRPVILKTAASFAATSFEKTTSMQATAHTANGVMTVAALVTSISRVIYIHTANDKTAVTARQNIGLWFKSQHQTITHEDVSACRCFYLRTAVTYLRSNGFATRFVNTLL